MTTFWFVLKWWAIVATPTAVLLGLFFYGASKLDRQKIKARERRVRLVRR